MRLRDAGGLIVGLAVLAVASAAWAVDVVVDNDNGAPGYTETGGPWITSGTPGFNGSTYRYVLDTDPLSSATWTPTIPTTGVYAVSLGLRVSTNRPSDTPITVNHANGSTLVSVNTNGTNSVVEVPVGSFTFNAGTGGSVTMTNNGSAGAYIADTVIFRSTVDAPPVVSNARSVPVIPTAGTPFKVVADVLDDGALSSVVVDYSVDGGPSSNVAASPVPADGPNAWGISVPAQAEGATVEYSFTATDSIAQATATTPQQVIVGASVPREWRSVWADSWNVSFLNSSQANTLVDTARANNLNTLMIEIRKIGDAYYNSAIEPRATNISGGAGFDPLAYVLQRAHDTTGGKQRVQVHGWFVMQRISKGETLNPQHVLSQHPEYIMSDSNGNTSGGGSIFLDPGHPGAVNHNVAVILDCLDRYPTMDGVNLDYIRYPEAAGDWGYNPVSVARFNAYRGRTGQPAGSDPLWSDWRRECVTLQVRKLHVKMRKYHPTVVLTACTINWGSGYANFPTSDAYAAVKQDWVGWLQTGILDYNSLMNYATSTSRYQGWTNLSLASDNTRGSIIGMGAYLQSSVQASIDQILYARNQGANGFNIYDWGSEVQGTGGAATQAQFYAALKAQVTPTWAEPPESPWITNPTTGIIEGEVLLGTTPIDHATVSVVGQAGTNTVSDGSGWFGVLDVAPGTRTVAVTAPGMGTRQVVVNDLAAGEVRTVSVQFGVPATLSVY